MKQRVLIATVGLALFSSAAWGLRPDIATQQPTDGGTIVYSAQFIGGQNSPAQCTAWKVFQAALVPHPYTKVTISGSMGGPVSCTNGGMVSALAAALRTNGSVGPLVCDGRRWAVGPCVSGTSLTSSSTGNPCLCEAPTYTVRPCTGNQNWGGVNTLTCDAPTQVMRVVFEFEEVSRGACCLSDGSCVENLTREQCAQNRGSTWHEGKKCGDVQCPKPPPRGACCLPDGSCADNLTKEECAAKNGTAWHEGKGCDEVDCEQPPAHGACCFEDGSCKDDRTEGECKDEGGVAWHEGEKCDDVECEQPRGACCLEDGDCFEGTELECREERGKFFLDRTCDEVDCPQPRGACCLPDGSCVETDEKTCEGRQGRFFKGKGCDEVECKQPPRGACCLPDGQCVDDVTKEKCDANQGVWHEGKKCSEGVCDQKHCLYKTKKIKKKKCRESGCAFERVDCTFSSGKSCDNLKDCRKKIIQKSKCVNPQEKGKCKHILRRCDCA